MPQLLQPAVEPRAAFPHIAVVRVNDLAESWKEGGRQGGKGRIRGRRKREDRPEEGGKRRRRKRERKEKNEKG